jgi:glycosyltransferase involved in cell wall biosynthesis
MKIGYLCSDFDIPLYGHEGCSVRIREFTNALVEQGHDVFLLCAELGKPAPVTVKARVIGLKHSNLNRLLFRTLAEEAIWSHDLERDLRLVMHNLWLQGEASSIIADERPDALYEVYALFGSGGIDLAHRHGIPHILEVNAPLCIEQAGYVKFPLHRSAQTIEDEIYRSANAVVVVSEWLRDFIVKRGANVENVHVIENGVAERLFASPESRGSTRAQLGLVDGERVVGCVGTYQYWHDTNGLIEAFAAVAGTDRRARLLLVGDGPERPQAESLIDRLGIRGRVIVLGAVPHERVAGLVAAMDVAVAPFKWRQDHLYGSPMKLFEYMAAGTPSISTAIEQTVDIIDHERTGWLYPPGDQTVLSRLLETVLENPEMARAVGNAGRKHIMSTYTWRTLADRAVTIAEGLISR